MWPITGSVCGHSLQGRKGEGCGLSHEVGVALICPLQGSKGYSLSHSVGIRQER